MPPYDASTSAFFFSTSLATSSVTAVVSACTSFICRNVSSVDTPAAAAADGADARDGQSHRHCHAC
jgi:hypothetical protein